MASKKRRKKNYEIEEEYYSLRPETKTAIFIVFLFAFAIISSLSFFEIAGPIGVYIDYGLAIIFGLAKYVFPIILIGLAYALLRASKYHLTLINYIGIILFILGLNALLHLQFELDDFVRVAFDGQGGGLLGVAFGYPAKLLMGFWASLVLLISITIISLLLIFNASLESFLFHKKILSLLGKNTSQDKDEDEQEIDDSSFEENQIIANEVKLTTKNLINRISKNKPISQISTTEKFADSKFKNVKIDLPLNLLKKSLSKPKSGDIKLSANRIETTLRNFGINVEMDEISVGPSVTQYTLKPADGVKLTKITSLSNDLALALAAHPIRIEAPIPGKSLVGIEVPNHQPAMVSLREILESDNFKQRKTNLTMGLGKDVAGRCWTTDLTKMPHLLVAGATGSGKSVCLNTIILSFLYQNNPDMLRFIMVDPKRVEFTIYNGIPHLLTPVITDVNKTINSLRWTIQEMDKRYDILAQAGKRNIASYNEVAEDKMPYIIYVIDELADLMIAASSEIESSIIRLTQMARAVGIHLILATQRPSVDVITGLIKANVPGRIAFSVASSMDSRTILDCTGAEKLIGKGDMLFQTAELSKPKRIQGAYIGDDEIKRVVTFLKQAGGEPEYDESVTEKQNSNTSFDVSNSSEGDEDELYLQAKELVIQAKKASASLLQRRFRIGYARAARLIDMLEENGVVGPADGARPREILLAQNSSSTNTSSQNDFIDENIDNDNEESTPTVFNSSSQQNKNLHTDDVNDEQKDDYED